MISVPLVMVANPSIPAKTVPEFIAYAKANPGKINMASSGIGATPHVAGELFKMMAGVDLVHVPYRGAGPAFADLLGGQVQVMFDFIPSSVEYVRSGKLRALGVTTTARAAALPDVPTLGEFVPGYEASGWFGLGAPKGTPAEIVDALNKETNAILGDEKVKARLADLGGTVLAGSPGRLREADWRRVREVGEGGEIFRRQAGLIESYGTDACKCQLKVIFDVVVRSSTSPHVAFARKADTGSPHRCLSRWADLSEKISSPALQNFLGVVGAIFRERRGRPHGTRPS